MTQHITAQSQHRLATISSRYEIRYNNNCHMATKGRYMMEEELRQLLRQHGWNLFTRKRREREYLYAQKWMKGEVYITSKSKLPSITAEEILKKIS